MNERFLWGNKGGQDSGFRWDVLIAYYKLFEAIFKNFFEAHSLHP